MDLNNNVYEHFYIMVVKCHLRNSKSSTQFILQVIPSCFEIRLAAPTISSLGHIYPQRKSTFSKLPTA